MANFIEVITRAAELTATIIKEYVDGFTSSIRTDVDNKLADVDDKLSTVDDKLAEAEESVEQTAQELREYVDNSPNTFTIDPTVTPASANAVSGAAVAAYVADQIAAIANYEGVAF